MPPPIEGMAPPVAPGSSGIAESNIPGSAPATASVAALVAAALADSIRESLFT